MFKRNRALRITAYVLSGVALNLALIAVVGLLVGWLIPDHLAQGLVGFLGGFVGGTVIDLWLFARYDNRYC